MIKKNVFEGADFEPIVFYEHMTTEDVASIFKVDKETVQKKARAGIIPCVRITGKGYVFDPIEIMKRKQSGRLW